MTILFPVYFRHPDAHPLPGDTILNRRGQHAADAHEPHLGIRTTPAQDASVRTTPYAPCSTPSAGRR